MAKQCFKCKNTKPTKDFYRHSQMADNHLGKCKECTKKDANARYYDPQSRERIIVYEKKRFQNPARKAKILIYQRHRRTRSPGKNHARQKVQYAIQNGQIKREPCEICGIQKTEAHHKDYRKYLDVQWLCRKHHLLAEGKIPF